MGKRRTAGYVLSRNELAPIREIRFGPDGQWPDTYESTDGGGVSPAAQIMSALSVAQAAVWFGIKVISVVIAAFFILAFAAASAAAIFAHGSSFPIGR
jgi:hypothetical protein